MDEEEDDDESSDEEDRITDDFLDMPIDFMGVIATAKREEKAEVTWSGQEVLLDFDPSYA